MDLTGIEESTRPVFEEAIKPAYGTERQSKDYCSRCGEPLTETYRRSVSLNGRPDAWVPNTHFEIPACVVALAKRMAALEKTSIPVRFHKRIPEAITPVCANGFDCDAGMDLFTPTRLCIARKDLRTIDTGLTIAVPVGYEAQLRPRSGLAVKHGIVIPNSPGTFDPGYRGPVVVGLLNLGPTDYIFLPGDRIAQLVFARYMAVELQEDSTVMEEATARGEGGFGSTGK